MTNTNYISDLEDCDDLAPSNEALILNDYSFNKIKTKKKSRKSSVQMTSLSGIGRPSQPQNPYKTETEIDMENVLKSS